MSKSTDEKLTTAVLLLGVWTLVCGAAQRKHVISLCFPLNTDGYEGKQQQQHGWRKI